MRVVPTFERFMSHVVREDSGCWLWEAGRMAGHGGFRTSSGMVLARRWIYAFQNDGLSERFVLDRLCSSKYCVNPAHHRPTLRLNSIEERLIAYSDRSGGPNSCWIWTRATNQGGYGKIHGGPLGRQAHRVSWIITNGPIPDNLMVMHACDNRRCINPAHLSLGTHHENMADMANKGRAVTQHGERNPIAKLTPNQVLEIRALYVEGDTTHAKLATQFGVSQTLIHGIVNGLAWRHVS